MTSPTLMKRLRRSDPRDGTGNGGELDLAAALHAEVVLLREENARLKSHDERGLGALLARARVQRTRAASPDDLGDSAADLFVEGMVMRESLLEACEEITRSLAVVEAKLRQLGPVDMDAVAGVR